MAASLHSVSPSPTPSLPGSARLGFRFGTFRLASFAFSPSFRNYSPLRVCASKESPRSGYKTRAASLELAPPVQEEEDSRVLQIHSREEFELALKNAKKKLVVVEYAASHSKNSAKIYPALVNLSRQAPDTDFLLVMGDESEELVSFCKDMGVINVPHFVFYKDGVKVHEEEGISPDQLYSDILYYGDADTPVKQLHSKEDFLGLVKEHMDDEKLVVIDMTLNNCGPCARVYPTVVNLSHQMEESAVFARMIGNENDSCKEMFKAFKVVEVPTFLFIRNGKLSGRYVGSGRGELIGEILRHQGVECT